VRYAAVILVVLALAGCGGSAGISGGGASVVPSTADAFVALDTRLKTNQWPAVAALLERFPVQDPLLSKLRTLKLGHEIDLVAVRGSLVVLTRSSHAQLSGFVSKKIGGWTAFAHDAATFDALGSNTTLASSSSYRQALKTLPSGALARAYAGPAAAQRLVTTMPGQIQVVVVPFGRRRRLPGAPRGGRPIATEQTVWTAAALVAGSHDVTLVAHARVLPPSNDVLATASYMQVPVPAYPARLVDEIPADALAVADFQVQQGEFELTDPAALPPALQTIVKQTPSFLNALDTTLGGETAIYVRPGNEVTLVTQPNDTKAASDQVAAVAPLFPGVKLHVTVFGGELVVSTSQRGLDAFRAAGARLATSPDFRQAGLPAATTGFVYGDLRSGSAAFGIIAPLFGLPVPAGPEHALLSYGTRKGSDATSILVLQTG